MTARIAALAALLLVTMSLTSCDLFGGQTSNSYQHVSNSIP